MILATLLLSLAAISPLQETVYDRDNVVICLDASGSMRDPLVGAGTSKMVAAKSAIATVLKTVPEDTQVGLFVFSGRGKRSEWVYRLGERNDRELIERMSPITGAGKTPLGKSLKKVTDALLEQRAKQNGYGTFRLLVVTDGQATDDDVLAAYLPDVLSRGIVMDVIGVAMKSDHDLATKVHSYRRADDARALQGAITEVFAELQDVDSQDAADNYELLQAFPENAIQGVIDRIASRNDEPILSMRQRKVADDNVVSVTLYGNGSGGSFSLFKFFAGSSFVCFLVFLALASIIFRIARGSKKSRRRHRRKRD